MLSLSKHARWGLLLALASCAESGSDEPKGEFIACALDGAAEFAKVCTMEIVDGGVVLHRPDGGFRRLQTDGARVGPADGAEAVGVTDVPAMGGFELKIGDDRYRTLLPGPTNAPIP